VQIWTTLHTHSLKLPVGILETNTLEQNNGNTNYFNVNTQAMLCMLNVVAQV
jgi:hypothetical protein